MAVRRALISVFDKTGVVEFAKRLAAQKIEILSTGGTAKLLREAGIAVRDVSDFTGWPEMLGGRVKTLHPKVHGGLLFRRGHTEDEKQAAEYGIAPIDLVAVNLYPFEATAAKAGLTATELIENIDIGGPTMLRSAAKNFESVTVVTDAADFERVARQIESAGETTLATRLELARKVFARTSRYDGMIATELERLSAGSGRVALEAKPVLPEFVHIVLRRQQELRYGENPHQAAALYVPAERAPLGLAAAKQLQGKELSYNNLVDLEAARSLAAKFKNPAAVIIKHNNPCGRGARNAGRCVLEGLGVRPGLGLRRGAGIQPRGGYRSRGRGRETFRGMHRRARLCGPRKRNLRGEEKPAAAGAARGWPGAGTRIAAQAHSWGDACAAAGPGGVQGRRPAHGDQACANGRRDARHALRVESGEAREVECHRLRQGWRDAGRRRRTDEPGRFRENCGDEGAIFAGRYGGCFRRILSLCGRS